MVEAVGMKVMVRLPKSMPWDALTLLGVGTLTHDWKEIEVTEPIAEWLRVKGLEIRASDAAEAGKTATPESGVKQGKKGGSHANPVRG
jgi:hypothetical protein